MKRILHSIGIATLGLVLAAVPAAAHHSAAAQYDLEKTIRVTGTLVKVEWQNPHNQYYVDEKDASGNLVHWGMEGAPPGHLFRDGVKRSTILDLVGSIVTVEGNPARDGSKNLTVHKMTLADGKQIPM
jgi:hypothetical protein